MSAAQERWIEAAVQGAWGCRLSYARIKTPVHPPAIDAFNPMGHPDDPWVYDWHAHILFASQLFEAMRALLPALDDKRVRAEFKSFADHWGQLVGLRNVLMHPESRDVNVAWLAAFRDRIEYRKPGHDPYWRFSIDDLHAPIEGLFDTLRPHRA